MDLLGVRYNVSSIVTILNTYADSIYLLCALSGEPGGAKEEDMPSSRFHALGFDVYVPDYISLADAVLGKLGYGFVSECLTLGTPLIYVPRQNWPEERYLEVSVRLCTMLSLT